MNQNLSSELFFFFPQLIHLKREQTARVPCILKPDWGYKALVPTLQSHKDDFNLLFLLKDKVLSPVTGAHTNSNKENHLLQNQFVFPSRFLLVCFFFFISVFSHYLSFSKLHQFLRIPYAYRFHRGQGKAVKKLRENLPGLAVILKEEFSS